MPATVVDLRAGSADSGKHETPALASARPSGLATHADSGELALLRERPIPSGVAIRRGRMSPTLLLFLVFVVAPTIAAGGYYFLLAADQYVAEFRFGLRSAEPVRAETGLLLQAGPAPLQTAIDSYAVAQYIGSRAIIDDLDKTLDLRRMFSTTAADWPARLHLPATIEELVVYWRRQIDAFFDPTNGTIVVRARAFTAPDALLLAKGILNSSERLVNRLSARARRDAVSSSQRDVDTAEHRLAAALARLRDYRDRQGLLDPHKTADTNSALDSRLRDEMAQAGAALSTLRGYMRGDAPSLKMLEARIEGLKAQQTVIESEATETAKTRNATLSRIMGSYEELESERRFAETAYQHSLEALDRARMAANRQQIYIADFVPPSLPEEALYPRRVRSLAIVFLGAFVVWGIGCLTVRSIRDHL